MTLTSSKNISSQYDIIGSIVLYKNDRVQLIAAIESFLSCGLKCKLLLIDNSPSDELSDVANCSNVEYHHYPSNPGFGAGHNVAIKKAQGLSQYFLVLNPDIYFPSNVLNDIIIYLDKNINIGVIMPKVLYPDGRTQYLAKLLPTPIDFIVRRFIPFKNVKEKMAHKFELRASNYNTIMDVPFLSGCFMIFRSDVLQKISGFDEHIFMYTEDIDICRRVIDSGFRSVFYPAVHVYHDHIIKSFLNKKTLAIYIKSAFYYFNKWGWVFDRRRSKINQHTLQQLK